VIDKTVSAYLKEVPAERRREVTVTFKVTVTFGFVLPTIFLKARLFGFVLSAIFSQVRWFWFVPFSHLPKLSLPT